ncbi:MAG: hypothetical protein JSW73_01015 [Candidatus Woesearchaeota archaeon]|nr:MAG: hypothetical protein JSW73_01015 [Candidatus Woesearchaeota archaeon]
MEDWELVLREIYRNDPELAKQKRASKLNTARLAKQLNVNDRDLALKLSFLKEQGLIAEKKKNLELTKRGTQYYTRTTAQREVRRGLFTFTSSLLIAVVFNFINWLRLMNPWLLLAIFFLCLSIIYFISIRFLE